MSYEFKLEDGSVEEFPTMLKALEELRIFDIVIRDKEWFIEECCDRNFSIRISRSQLTALAGELYKLIENWPVTKNEDSR